MAVKLKIGGLYATQDQIVVRLKAKCLFNGRVKYRGEILKSKLPHIYDVGDSGAWYVGGAWTRSAPHNNDLVREITP